MRHALLTVLAATLLVAGCQSNPFSSTPAAPQQPQGPQIQAPPPPRVQQDPVTPRQRAEIHTDLAAGYYERVQLDVALEELANAEKIDPTYARIYSLYGLVYTVTGDLPRAETNFRRSIELAPGDPDVRHNWGAFLCTHGRARESIAEFEAALASPQYRTPEVALVNAGKCSNAIGNTAAADEYYRRALQIRPTDPAAAYNLALSNYRSGRLAESRSLMKIVMQQTQPGPEALFLGMCIERGLGDRSSEQSYVMQLQNRFPESAETRAIPTGGCQ